MNPFEAAGHLKALTLFLPNICFRMELPDWSSFFPVHFHKITQIKITLMGQKKTGEDS